MSIHDLLLLIQDAGYSTAIREGSSLFPWIESVHVLAITLVVGTISIIDLRLLGLPAHRTGLRKLMADVLPLTWVTFALAAATGFLMFSSNAVKYAGMPDFQIKMVLILVAGLNMGFFHFITFRDIETWDELAETPVAAKVAGGGSLILWVSVTVFGRLIGFATS